MAGKKKDVEKIRLVSTADTGYFYTTTKNRKNKSWQQLWAVK